MMEKKERMKQYTLKVDENDLTKGKEAKALMEANPRHDGMRVSLSAVIRRAIKRGLEIIAQEEARDLEASGIDWREVLREEGLMPEEPQEPRKRGLGRKKGR